MTYRIPWPEPGLTVTTASGHFNKDPGQEGGLTTWGDRPQQEEGLGEWSRECLEWPAEAGGRAEQSSHQKDWPGLQPVDLPKQSLNCFRIVIFSSACFIPPCAGEGTGLGWERLDLLSDTKSTKKKISTGKYIPQHFMIKCSNLINPWKYF